MEGYSEGRGVCTTELKYKNSFGVAREMSAPALRAEEDGAA